MAGLLCLRNFHVCQLARLLMQSGSHNNGTDVLPCIQTYVRHRVSVRLCASEAGPCISSQLLKNPRRLSRTIEVE